METKPRSPEYIHSLLCELNAQYDSAALEYRQSGNDEGSGQYLEQMIGIRAKIDVLHKEIADRSLDRLERFKNR
jgi:hypothetical protein